jgi:phosphatidylglycerol:prolipoprotein diacylglycerol transferase
MGGIAAAALFFHRRRLRFFDYADALAIAVAVGWSIARVGCFVVHDHPGKLTSFPLAVQFPDGPRHDLGLYDALLLASIALVLAVCRRRGWLRGKHMGLLALLYGLGRFALDFLRATDLPYVDRRYLGLTPAQYACGALVAFGIWRLLLTPATPKCHGT